VTGELLDATEEAADLADLTGLAKQTGLGRGRRPSGEGAEAVAPEDPPAPQPRSRRREVRDQQRRQPDSGDYSEPTAHQQGSRREQLV
jgi:hypothetical protein